MYDDISDYELLDRISDSDYFSETLFKKYQPLIEKIARTIYSKNKYYGIELSDLIQEGMIGLSVAIDTFDEKKDASFYTFARLCIIRRISSCVSSLNRKKHQFLNDSVSVDKLSEKSIIKDGILSDSSSNPEKLIISDESIKEVMRSIEKELTDFECEVFELKTAGFSLSEISKILEKDKKSISNATDRIKFKINGYLKKAKV